MQPDLGGTSAEAIRRIATLLADPTANGMRAALRRMAPAKIGTPALQYLLAAAVPQGLPGDDAAWALVIHCMSHAAPKQHMGRDRLGEELAKAKFSEQRLVRLLSPNADLADMLPRAVRFLIARGGALNGRDLWDFVRPAMRPLPDETALDRARTRIARDFYRSSAAFSGSARAATIETETTP